MCRNYTNLTTFFLTLSFLLLSFSSFSKESKIKVKKGSFFVVTMSTTHGDIILRLLNETPTHRNNFVRLAREGFYNNVLFHRVIKDFMIQVGDNTTRDRSTEARENYGEGGASYTLTAEILPQFQHYRGVVAAAREGENNPEKRSSGSHFYIVQSPATEKVKKSVAKNFADGKITQEQRDRYLKDGGTPHLDGNYTIFGEVLSGMNVVDAIANEKVNKNNCPEKDIEIISVKVKQQNKKKIKKHITNYE